jgi:hypothetical protein
MIRTAARLSPLLVGLAAGCSSGATSKTDAAADAMLSPSCREAEQHSDLAWLQEQVFTPSCAAFASCHSSTGQTGVNLEAGATMASLVDVRSALEPTLDLVEPGAPADSYLLVILGHFGADDSRIDPGVGTMPQANDLLCKPKRDAVARWIESLAPAAR